MSSNSNTYSVSNEHILLVDILNGMYNDNLRQINNFTNSINNLNETNTQIRNVLIKIIKIGVIIMDVMKDEMEE